MPSSTVENCIFSSPLYWDKSAMALLPPDSGLSNGGSFVYSAENCTTSYIGSTSTTPSVMNGFTYGNIVISSILMIWFIFSIYSMFFNIKRA